MKTRKQRIFHIGTEISLRRSIKNDHKNSHEQFINLGDVQNMHLWRRLRLINDVAAEQWHHRCCSDCTPHGWHVCVANKM